MEISLTPYEMMTAAQVGVMRQVQNLKNGRQDAYGATTFKGWQMHIEGAMGECAVAKALGLYWNGSIGNLSAADVGCIEVRTRSRHSYDLILHDRDNDDAFFILVTGANGRYKLRGYIRGHRGKDRKYWSDPAGGRPAYFVPQKELCDMDTLERATND